MRTDHQERPQSAVMNFIPERIERGSGQRFEEGAATLARLASYGHRAFWPGTGRAGETGAAERCGPLDTYPKPVAGRAKRPRAG